MKEIYLVQVMEREEFKKYALKGVAVDNLQYHGHVRTMWCDSKRKAINCCRKYNRRQQSDVFFVQRIYDFTK